MPTRIAVTVASLTSFLSLAVGTAEESRPLAVAELKRAEAVDFNREILPILRKNCIPCHNESKASGDLVLETHETVLAGIEGEEPVIVPGESSQSVLFLVTAHRDKPIMPPPKNEVGAEALGPEELALIELWIDQGAKPGESASETAAYPWHPLPRGKQPIYAVALSEDGQHAACARANQIFVHHLPTGGAATRLTDPALIESGVYDRPGVAHLDHVQSLAFHPNGDLLASGSYRTVKLWKRGAEARSTPWSLPEGDSGEEAEPTAAAVSPAGDGLAVGTRRGSIFVGSIGGALRRLATSHEGEVTAIEFAPGGQHVVTAGLDGRLRFVEIASGVEVTESIDTTSPVRSVALVDGGERVLTGGEDGVIRLWKASWRAPEATTATSATENAENAENAERSAATGGETETAQGTERSAATSDEEQPQAPSPAPEAEFRRHSKAVTALAVVPPSGEEFVSASEDGSVRRWHRPSGKESRRVDHGASITAVAIRADGQVLASAGADKTVKLWNVGDGKQLAALEGDFRLERELLKRTWDQKISERRLAEAKKNVEGAEKELQKRAEEAKKQSEVLAAAEKAVAEKRALVENASNGVKAAEARVEESRLAADRATQSKSEAEKAKAAAETAVKDTEAKAAEARTAAEKFPRNEFLKVAVESAEKAVADRQAEAKRAAEAIENAVATIEKTGEEAKEAAAAVAAKRKDLEKAEEELKKTEEELKKKEPLAKLAAAALEDARKGLDRAKSDLETRTEDDRRCGEALETARTRSAASERVIQRLQFSNDNRRLGGVAADGSLFVWSAADGTPFEVRAGADGGALALARRGETGFVGVGSDRVTVWDLEGTWTLARQLGDVGEPSVFVDRVTALAFSRDGELLATGGGDPSRRGELKVWSVADGELLLDLPEAHSDSIFGVDFSSDRRYIASCGADKFVKVFDLADGKLVRAFEGHTNHVLGVSWRYDGEWLASCGADNNIKVWDFDRGEQRRNIGGFGKQVSAIRFVADSSDAIACSGDAIVRLLQASDGKTRRDFGGNSDYVYSVAATLEGNLVAAGGFDGVLRIWSEDGKVLHTFEPPE